MHVVVSGTEYHFDALNKASLLDLIELKKQTGLTMESLGAIVSRLDEAKDDDGFDFTSDEGGLVALAVMIWLARRRAGERSLKFEDSADVPLDEIQFVADAEEPIVEPPDPQ